jgi:hypothetical protein
MGMRTRAVAKAVLSRVIALHPFYVSRPQLWSPYLWEIDARIAISQKHKFCYVRIPKSANTAVTSTLFFHEHGEAPTEQFQGKRAFKRPSTFVRLTESALEDLFCFSFVRNPYHRILSAYLSKLVAKADKSPYRDIGAAITRRFGGEPTFGAFCAYLAAGGLYGNPHWYPQSKFIEAVGAERMDFIGKVENMAEGIAHVSRALFGVADRATYDNDAKTGASSRLGEHYDERSRQIVAGLYREDFERFGYDAATLA